MQTVLLVIHLIVALALIGAVLLQRSEGGALGIGSGGGGGARAVASKGLRRLSGLSLPEASYC